MLRRRKLSWPVLNYHPGICMEWLTEYSKLYVMTRPRVKTAKERRSVDIDSNTVSKSWFYDDEYYDSIYCAGPILRCTDLWLKRFINLLSNQQIIIKAACSLFLGNISLSNIHYAKCYISTSCCIEVSLVVLYSVCNATISSLNDTNSHIIH
jgi:hypothetical protein